MLFALRISIQNTTCFLELWTKNLHQILTILYPDYNLFCGSPNAFRITNCLSRIRPVFWSYEQKIITKFLQFSIRTTTCFADHQMLFALRIVYPEYHLFFGAMNKKSSPNSYNSLSGLQPVLRITKCFSHYELSIQNRTCFLELWTKNHHQILPSLCPDYHVFGAYGKTSSTKSFQFSIQNTTCFLELWTKKHHQILTILYPDYQVFGGYGKSHHQILRILVPDYRVFGGYGNISSSNPSIQTTTCLEDMEKPHQPNPLKTWKHGIILRRWKNNKSSPHILWLVNLPPLNVPMVNTP